MPPRLALIGAGPKAAALALKVDVLRKLGVSAPELTIFDPGGPAAAWTGRFGYTDGSSRLCTPADRDLAFPYSFVEFGRRASVLASAIYSWRTFLLESGGGSHAAWIDRGMPRPRHAEFAEYVSWTFDTAHQEVETDAVSAIEHDLTTGLWKVSTSRTGPWPHLFEAVVVTGSGPPRERMEGADGTVFDGRDFWHHGAAIGSLLESSEDPTVVIMGSGGTAAAVASWVLAHSGSRPKIQIVGSEPTLFLRAPNYFESRLFSDEEAWTMLSRDKQRRFVERLTRGVVWADVLEGLSLSENIVYMSGKARKFDVEAGGSIVLVVGRDGLPDETLAATVFVDCTGFQPLWFSQLLPVDDLGRAWVGSANRSAIEDVVDRSLALGLPFPYPSLHVPMLGSRQGPAASNLMALGWMADRILRPYVSLADVARLVTLK